MVSQAGRNEMIDQFMEVTDIADRSVVKGLLEEHNWDLQNALNLYFAGHRPVPRPPPYGQAPQQSLEEERRFEPPLAESDRSSDREAVHPEETNSVIALLLRPVVWALYGLGSGCGALYSRLYSFIFERHKLGSVKNYLSSMGLRVMAGLPFTVARNHKDQAPLLLVTTVDQKETIELIDKLISFDPLRNLLINFMVFEITVWEREHFADRLPSGRDRRLPFFEVVVYNGAFEFILLEEGSVNSLDELRTTFLHFLRRGYCSFLLAQKEVKQRDRPNVSIPVLPHQDSELILRQQEEYRRILEQDIEKHESGKAAGGLDSQQRGAVQRRDTAAIKKRIFSFRKQLLTQSKDRPLSSDEGFPICVKCPDGRKIAVNVRASQPVQSLLHQIIMFNENLETNFRLFFVSPRREIAFFDALSQTEDRRCLSDCGLESSQIVMLEYSDDEE